MSDLTSPLASPSSAVTRLRPSRRFELNLDELWRYRELLYILAWRDVKVRYKQTALGVVWAILQPLVAMLIFTFVFGRVSGIGTSRIPYPVFVYAGLLPWTYFAQSLTQASNSLVSNANLVTKVYLPRLLLPSASVMVPIVDMAVGSTVLAGLMAWYGVVPNWHIVFLPGFLALAFATALGIGLFLAAVNVRYRDIPYAIPFVIQAWMFFSPVIYSVGFLSDRWRWLLSVNPMTGVLEGFRWSLLGEPAPDMAIVAVSLVVAVLSLLGGFAYFRLVERHFADRI